MSVGSKSLLARRSDEGGENSAEDGLRRGGSTRSKKQKPARYDRRFSGLDLRIGSGPLKEMDAGKLKSQIRKWAKAVVAFARQISFGSPRSVKTTSSSGSDDTPRSASATFTAASSRGASRLGGAKNEPPVTA